VRRTRAWVLLLRCLLPRLPHRATVLTCLYTRFAHYLVATDTAFSATALPVTCGFLVTVCTYLPFIPAVLHLHTLLPTRFPGCTALPHHHVTPPTWFSLDYHHLVTYAMPAIAARYHLWVLPTHYTHFTHTACCRTNAVHRDTVSPARLCCTPCLHTACLHILQFLHACHYIVQQPATPRTCSHHTVHLPHTPLHFWFGSHLPTSVTVPVLLSHLLFMPATLLFYLPGSTILYLLHTTTNTTCWDAGSTCHHLLPYHCHLVTFCLYTPHILPSSTFPHIHILLFMLP